MIVNSYTDPCKYFGTMASTDNMCVICQEPLVLVGFSANDVVPLPCIHTYHRGCLREYVANKRNCRADIECPICREVAFHFGTVPYDAFHMCLCDPHEIKQTPTRPIRPKPTRHVTVYINQITPSEIVVNPVINAPNMDETKRFRFSSKFFLALVILIVMFAIIIALVVSYNIKKQ